MLAHLLLYLAVNFVAMKIMSPADSVLIEVLAIVGRSVAAIDAIIAPKLALPTANRLS